MYRKKFIKINLCSIFPYIHTNHYSLHTCWHEIYVTICIMISGFQQIYFQNSEPISPYTNDALDFIKNVYLPRYICLHCFSTSIHFLQ